MQEVLTEFELKELKEFCKNIRLDILEMIYNAKSGHPGGSLSAVEIIATLYKKCINHYPEWNKSDKHEKRDRFILSKGHASATLYAVLAHCKYFPVEELKTFRQLGTRLQGHPSKKHLPGIEASTGSLGQGLSVACGMALALRLNNNPAKVVVFLGDGELQEGSIWEALMNAAHYNLSNIIAFVDRNNLQIDNTTEKVMSLEPLNDKIKAFGWNVIEIDGHNCQEIFLAYQKAKSASKPTIIIANTIKGKGISFMENTVAWHGKPPKEEEYNNAINELKGGKIC